ncbi:MAG TPA: CoA transferase [Dehalococcoidia bacterium]|nr:CoA transferase [Dehalococcoidia bacterium]
MPLPDAGPDLPLSGLRVIDFSTTVAGPSAARHLADFGAQVIKVESQAHPDTLRAATPFPERKAGVNRSAYFAAYNAGKLSLSLNMQKPEAREIVRRLIERSDVLIEAFVPGVMARWGLSYEQVSAWNPRIIMASHCLQGQTGPHAQHRGYGQIAGAMSGWYDLTGLEGGEPLGPYSAYTDFVSWPFLLSAILVALEVREETGRGQYIDHAQLESSIHFLAAPLLDLQLNGHELTRRGNREDYVCPNNVYPCAGPGDPSSAAEGRASQTTNDRWIAITVDTDDAWLALCRELGHAGAGADPRFATRAGRKAYEAEIDALLAGWVADEEPFALAERLQAAGIAAGVVERAEDLFADPQLQQRGFFRRLPHAEIGEHAVLTQSFRVEGWDPGPHRAAPLLGEHTHDICREVLELGEDEIARFAAAGVFE